MNKLKFSYVDITDGYTVSLPACKGSIRFNRISFSYSASSPVRAEFEYRQDSDTLKEELLLGSKEKKTSMLLDGYLDRKIASRLISVRFAPVVKGQKGCACRCYVSSIYFIYKSLSAAEITVY
ncbi:MAG: hypothetical protein K6G90_10160 [Clostridia bacterium]|nr:hypothetical protein [Clostridia bacterium]